MKVNASPTGLNSKLIVPLKETRVTPIKLQTKPIRKLTPILSLFKIRVVKMAVKKLEHDMIIDTFDADVLSIATFSKN